jgi:hypothetical protein
MSLYPSPYFGSAYGLNATAFASVDQSPVAPEEKAKTEAPLERDKVFSAFPSFPHYCKNAPPPSLMQYRWMRWCQPVSFSFALVVNPIHAGTRNLIIREQDGGAAPPRKTRSGLNGVTVGDSPEDKRKKLAEDVFKPLWPQVLEGLECLNYGHWLHEVLWDRWMSVIAPVRLKSIAPGTAELQKDKFDDFAGFKLGQEERDARYAFLSVNNPHHDPLFGVPRLAAAYMAVLRFVRSHENSDRLEQKASGRQFLMLVANGKTTKVVNGVTQETDQYSDTELQKFVDAGAKGDSMQASMFAFTLQAIKDKPELAKIPKMEIKPIDWGDSGPAIIATIARRAELAVEIVRAYHRPEREAMEGQHGTKAEAGAHGQVGITDSELVGAQLYGQFNAQVFNRYLTTNYGPTAIDSMYWQMAPLADPQQTFKEDVIKAMLASPTTGPDVERHIEKRDLLKAGRAAADPRGSGAGAAANAHGCGRWRC